MNTSIIRQLFQAKFDYPTYCNEIVHNVFGCNDISTRPELLDTTADGDNSYYIGRQTDADGRELGFFYTRVAQGSDVRRKRVGLRKMIAPYLKYDVDAAIAVFADESHWRLSYICDMKEGVTNAKRFSYILGDEQGQYKTPLERLDTIYAKRGRFVLNDLREAFSVDALSDEFFDEYHIHYDRIVAELARQGKTGAMYHDYVKKLMGRIVFLHFLQKKGWLCGDTNFMLNTFSQSNRRSDYLESVLEPLFFGILNTEPIKREQVFSRNGWQQDLVEKWANIPYLNGGLFERDEVDNLRIVLPESIFSNLFAFLASYNFTVDENDPDDAEIGVDPEMLGKIFESLLEDNKAKGAFYTPKEIVRYMCKESLIAYLVSSVETRHGTSLQDDNKGKAFVRAFVEQHEMQPELELYRDTLSKALREVKICDPAIGSGAFPMGLLNELWRCREALGTQMSRLELKKEIIENNIYGVDIERGAIDIARLRFWLSIVVDSEKAEPLPNFDYKFMQGNSLIESYGGFDLSRIAGKTVGRPSTSTQYVIGLDSDLSQKNLHRLLREYFSVTDHQKKATMRHAINAEVKTLIRESVGGTPTFLAKLEQLDPSANQDFFLWHTWFKDIFDKGGFDIVIGNPPYGAKYSEECKRYYKEHYVTAKTITGKQKASLDTFTLFIEHGYNILKTNGNLAFIVPIALTSSDSLSGIHRILLEKCDNIYISSYAVRPKPVFERAVVNTSILLFTKTEKKCHYVFSTKMHRRNEDKFNLQYLVDHLQFTDVKDYMLYGRVPKIGSEIEKNILRKINSHKKLSAFYNYKGSPIYYRTTGGRYFKVVTNYPTGSTKEKSLLFDKRFANTIGCALSSNLSFWFYQIYSNNLDWKVYEIENFTLPILANGNIDNLERLYKKYLVDIEKNANIRLSTGDSKYLVDSFKEYKIVRSKSIIDEIDDYIGPLYGLTQEEIDFIKNYELEFRMAGE
ncbi:MAG: N-6 DNA methylase [Bacteroidales bacterium]|nr:N-6 DNA methylase [Bacteroidales bacterium]